MLGKENEERRENHVRELPGHHDDQGGGKPPHREREDGQQARFRRQDQELPDRKGPALHQEPGQGFVFEQSDDGSFLGIGKTEPEEEEKPVPFPYARMNNDSSSEAMF
jgi:hypothetical protein